jgi:hypothetical protein
VLFVFCALVSAVLRQGCSGHQRSDRNALRVYTRMKRLLRGREIRVAVADGKGTCSMGRK